MHVVTAPVSCYVLEPDLRVVHPCSIYLLHATITQEVPEILLIVTYKIVLV